MVTGSYLVTFDNFHNINSLYVRLRQYTKDKDSYKSKVNPEA